MTHVGVHVQKTQVQPNLVNNPLSVNQHLSWPQHVTPLIAWQPKTIPYLKWYIQFHILYLWILTYTQCTI